MRRPCRAQTRPENSLSVASAGRNRIGTNHSHTDDPIVARRFFIRDPRSYGLYTGVPLMIVSKGMAWGCV